jgi:hypothetical protein
MAGSGNRISRAPTSRLGDGRRRFRSILVRSIAVLLVASAIGGCIGVGIRPAPRPSVPVGPLGQILPDPGASGPPIECRGVANDRCLSAGSIEGMIAGIDVSFAERVIVSCEGAPCTASGGAMRIDLLLLDGSTVEVARGGYGDFVQP